MNGHNIELNILTYITRHLPKIRGTGIVGNSIRRFYIRKRREKVIRRVFGLKMLLNPHECVDSALLFIPQLYDHREISFIRDNLKPGDIFVDAGSNIGFYALVASSLIKEEKGRVVSIEAVPYVFEMLQYNIELNNISNITAINIGVSSKRERLQMKISSGKGLYNNSGGNSFLVDKDGEVVEIECKPLINILYNYGISKIDGLKLDVEGFEYRTLKSFMRQEHEKLFPRFIILEQHPGNNKKYEGDSISLLKDFGYRVNIKTRHHNYVMDRVV